MPKTYRDLNVWQKAMDLAEEVYRSTAGFPSDERYGLTAQVRRAAVSVPSNIAEGHGRESAADLRHFLAMARGSVREVETQMELSCRLGLVDRERLQLVADLATGLAIQLTRFIETQQPPARAKRAGAHGQQPVSGA